MKLGEKVKKRRRELGLTQAALAGEQITRNMLSQIENGGAEPSLATLRYLAAQLGMPVGYFLSEEADEFFYRKQSCYPRLLSLFRAGNYSDCLRTFEREISECDDELGLMMAVSSFACGKRAFATGAMDSAVSYLSATMDYTSETVYPTAYLRAGCRLLLAIAGNVQAPLLEFNEPAYIDCLREAGCLDVYCYLTERRDYVYENHFFADHLAARDIMRQGDYVGALREFCRIEEQKGAEEITAFLLFRLYADMEVAYREVGNYEGAYRYSTKRMSLLSAFRS